MQFYHWVKEAVGMVNSVDPDQEQSEGAVSSGFTLFAQTCLSKHRPVQ